MTKGTRAMQGFVRGTLAIGLVLAIAGCGNPSDDASSQPAGAETAAADAAAPQPAPDALAAAPAAFAQCHSCHSVQPGQHGVGPSLAGVYGTKAGDIPGYVFSDALKASGLTWDDATLDKWLASPMTTVPGTKMVYPGQPDAAKRKELIAYLKTLK